MKFFIVVDSNAQPIYHNHSDKLVCHPLWAAHQFFSHNFQEALTSVTCVDGTRFALEKFDLPGEAYFLALVVTDEGETEPFLRSQLHLTKELLYLECGPQGLTNAGITPLPSRRISSLIGTMTRFCSLRQSFLVQSTEELLAHSTSSNVNDSIAAILSQKIESLPQVHHAILCVGTKIVTICKKSKSKHLSSQDLFLLTLLFSSHFEPYHLPKQAAPGSPDEEYAQAHRPLDITSQVLHIGSKYRLIELVDALEVAGIEGISSRSNLDCTGPIIKALKRVLVHANLHDGEISSEFDDALVKTLIKLQMEHKVDPCAGQLCFATLKAIVRYVIYPSLPETEDDIATAAAAAAAAASSSTASSDDARKSQQPGKSSSGPTKSISSPPSSPSVSNSASSSTSPPTSKTPSSSVLGSPSKPAAAVEVAPLSELEESIIALRYLVDDRPKVTDEEMHVKRVYQTCYLSSNDYKPGTVFLARFLDRITLVLLSSATTESADERASMKKVEKSVQADLATNYGGYILSMESSYTMVAYMHLLPGLVHFISVERNANRFLAPEITSLGGDVPASLIKRHVWQLCYQATEFLSRGVFEMVQTHGPFQYSYKLFFMDPSGAIIYPREQRAIEHKAAVTRGFYKKLTKTLFPTQPVKCFELFCLYIGSISLKVIQRHNDALISHVTKKT